VKKKHCEYGCILCINSTVYLPTSYLINFDNLPVCKVKALPKFSKLLCKERGMCNKLILLCHTSITIIMLAYLRDLLLEFNLPLIIEISSVYGDLILPPN